MKANGILQSLVFTSILSLFDLVSGQDGEHPEVRIHTRCKNKDDFMLTFHE